MRSSDTASPPIEAGDWAYGSARDAIALVAADLAGCFELELLLQRILEHAATLLGCDSGSIALIDGRSGTYTKAVDRGVRCQEGRTFSLDEGVTGRVVAERCTVVLSEYAQVEHGHLPPDDPRVRSAVLGTPIWWQGEIIGACILFSRAAGRGFTPQDLATIELFAEHAAIALVTARLYADAADRERASAVAEERERAVRDIHETVGRTLSALLLELSHAEEEHRLGRSPLPVLESTRTLAHDALAETRRTALGLEPGALTGRTLSEAIQDELDRMEAAAGVRTSLVTVGASAPVEPEVAHQAFRIVQEALSNVQRHARAASVRVGLLYGPDSFGLMIEDDGRGFDPATVQLSHRTFLRSGSLGLSGMSARARHLGGDIEIESTPGWGTRIRVSVPTGPGEPSRLQRRWTVVVANREPLLRAGLIRLVQIHEPAINIAAEVGSIGQLATAVSLLRPDVVVVDLTSLVDQDFGQYLAAADKLCPAPALVAFAHDPRPADLRAAARLGVKGYVGRDCTPESISRVLVAAGRGDPLLEAELVGRFTRLGDGPDLTLREQEVRELVEQGLADKQIATRLQISAKTVEKHVGAILRKTGARNRTMLARLGAN